MTRAAKDWMGDAACGTPTGYLDDRFFADPQGHSGADRRAILADRAEALDVCNGKAIVVNGIVKWGIRPCPVRELCLAWTMKNEAGTHPSGRVGVFGGLTSNQRRKLDLVTPDRAPTKYDERRDAVHRMVRQGMTDQMIASQLGEKKDTVAAIRRRAGIPCNPEPTRMGPQIEFSPDDPRSNAGRMRAYREKKRLEAEGND